MGFGAQVHLPALSSLPGVEVIAIAGGGSGTARHAALALGVSRTSGAWRDVVAADDIDAVSVATPPSLHTEVVCAALSAGKHVLCEKPFGRTTKEAAVMVEAARNSGRVSAVNFQFRMEPGIVALKRQVEAGTIGRVRRIDVAWLTGGRSDPSRPWSWQHDAELGGGVLGALVSHVIDYVEWIVDQPIVGLFARTQILIHCRSDKEGRQRSVTAEDSADLICALAQEGIANLRVSNCYRHGSGHQIDIVGDLGRLTYRHQAPFAPDEAQVLVELGSKGLVGVPLEPLPCGPGRDTRTPAFRQLASRFVDAIRGRAVRDLPDFHRGLRIRQLLDAARESHRLGKWIPCAH